MVVAIILILAGFGFVAVNRYQKRLKRVEMDNVAREIFVAAQNHLTASRAAGFWDGYVAQMEKGSSNQASNQDFSSKLGKPVGKGSTDKQYVADQENRNAEASSGASAKSSDNVLKILLPYAAVDETLLTDGKYYVHYDAATASVLDVYYTDKDTIPEYDKLNSNAKNNVSYRTEHGVGWYGTDAIPDTKPQSELKAPVMAVRNAESLVVYIIDPNYKQFKSGVQLEIAQTGQDGKKTGTVEKNLTLNSTGSGLKMGGDSPSGFVQVQHVTDADNKPITLADGSTAKDYMLYAVVLDSITRKDGHFSQLFANTGLVPGADITVTATVSSEQASGDAKSSVTTNSLFEALNGEKALISNARHLENLSGDISALGAQVTTAEITDDLYWNGIRRTKADGSSYAPYTGSAEAFIDAIRRADWKYGYQSLDAGDRGSDGSPVTVHVYSSDGTQKTDARKFAGIETATLQKLSGNDHVLTGFDIVADFAGSTENAAPSGAGLFASTGNSFEIDHLTVKNTRVYAAYSSGSSAAQLSAGTLVGNANGSVTLKDASAVTDCMRNGEIYKAGTYSLADGKSGLAADSTSGSGSQSTSVSLVENQISGVYSMDGIAGGLIGTAGGNLKIENSFASVPVYSAASSSGTGSNSGATGNAGIAGGLVGKVAGGTITGSFAGGYTEGSGSQGGSLSASSAGSGNSSASSSAAGTTSGTSTASTSNDYTSTTINVAAPNGIAGGLIGAVTGILKTSETYTTTSVSASVGGGFVGVVSGGGLDLSECYSTGRVFAKTASKDKSGKFAGNVADISSIMSSESLRAADASKSIAEVKNGVLAGTASSNGETSENWTFPANLVGGETDSAKGNPDTLQEIPAEDLAAVAGNDDFKAESQTTKTGVLTYSYNSSLKGKDYPYPSYTSTSDNSSIQKYAGYDTTGTTTNYKAASNLHYGDWVVLSEDKSSDVVLGNDAVLYADLKVPEEVAKKGSDGAMTLIVVGESSKNAVCFVIKKDNADDEPVHGIKLNVSRLSCFGQEWYKYDTEQYKITTDTTAIIKKTNDQSTDISVSGAGESSGSSGASSNGVTYRIYLDDITTAKGHFGIVCPVLVPGENIKVFATAGDKKLPEDELKKYIDEKDVPEEARANSLFGNQTKYDVDKKTGAAQILNGRHLQNLDRNTSGLYIKSNYPSNCVENNINYNSAYLGADIDWNIFKDQVAQCKETSNNAGKGEDICVYSYSEKRGNTNIFQGILNYDWNSTKGITEFAGRANDSEQIHTIRNLNIERTTDKNSDASNMGALFPRNVKDMTIHDLNMENITSVSDQTKGAAVLIAYPQSNVSISNVQISGQISVSSKSEGAGILLGFAQGNVNIDRTRMEGSVSVAAGPNGRAGGFIGYANGGEAIISNSSIHFTADGSSQDGQIMQSSITGGASVGGLVGRSDNITIRQTSVTCDDNVQVSITSNESNSNSNAGGIIGYAGNLWAEHTYAGGTYFDISGSQNAGGFAGTVQDGVIDDSAASAYVKASGNGAAAGGFVGNANNVTISKSYAGGHTTDGQYQDAETGEGRYNVQSSGNAGGFAGTTNGGTISSCYWTASVSGASSTGGFRGTGSGKITNSYCTGLVKTTSQTQPGAFAGDNWEASYTNEEIKGNRYITRINASQKLSDVGNNGQNHVATGVAYSDLVQKNKSEASPFDEILTQEDGYPFQAVNKINGVVHYGDWPLLQPPKSLDVTVTNDEILYADVAPEDSSASLPENVTVVIKGQSSKHYQQFVITLDESRNAITSIQITGWADGQQGGNSQEIGSESLGSYARITNRKLRLYLDDVTAEGGTFAALCPDLWPGEAIKVVAYEGAQTMDAESLSSYAVSFDKADAHNSLFADSTQIAVSQAGNNIQAHISMNRHLQNLDVSTSHINDDAASLKVTGAVLDNDLDWSTFASKVAAIKGTKASSVHYTGIVNSDLTDFDGNSHTISSLTIDNSDQTVGDTDIGASCSGLFREIHTVSEIKIHDLTLKNMASTGTIAGGLVGMHSGGTLTIDNVGVLYDDDSSAAITASGSNGNAGGLVGMSSSSLSIKDSVVAGKNMTVTSGDSASAGGLVGAHSAGTLTISSSAAAVYVQGGLAAGGVIGSADSTQGSKITNTYAGGHTVNGFYANSQDGVGRFNVRATAQAGNAGGLIGAAKNGYISVDNTYSTASVSGATAGGLIGTAGANVAVQKSYATGLVDSSAQTAGAFIGNNKHPYSADSSDVLPGNVYLRGVNLVTLGATGKGSPDQDDGPASSTVARPASYSEMAREAGSGTASPYDTKLGKNYAFRQAAAIRNIVHYGDWPTVDRMNTQYLVTFHYRDWNASAADRIIRRIAFADSATNVASVVTPDLASISGALEAHDAFMGWFASYDSSAEKVEDYAFQNITSDLTVYAHVETAVEFIRKDPTNPDNADKTVIRISSFEKGTENATLTLPKHDSFLSSGYKFDGWYLGEERLGTTGDHIHVTGELKTTLKNANYTVTARYTKLKTYEVRVCFITKNEQQSDQEAIKKANGKGWTGDWVYTAPYGNHINKEKLSLPIQPNNYQAASVCKDDGTNLFPGSGPETSGITASLSDNNTKLTFHVEGPKVDAEESADSNVTIYVIYQAKTAKYTVQHIFEDTKNGTQNFVPEKANVSNLKKLLTYSKGEKYTLEQVYPADTVGQMTKAQALTEDQLPEGFHQEGWIEQKSIAANGSTTIQIRYVRNTYTLSYDLNGGKSLSKDADGKNIVKQGYRTSEAYQYGQTVTLPDENEIIRSGYTLGSGPSDLWAVISKADYDRRSTAGQSMIQRGDTLQGTSFTMPATDCYAIANWKEKEYAGVSVEIWRQKTTDAINAAKNTYDYEKTVSISADALKQKGYEVGTSLTYDQLLDLSNAIPENGDTGYEHFTYDNRAIDSPPVKADGSTVIKLYYNRNVITIDFGYYEDYDWLFYEEWKGLYQSNFADLNYVWPSDYQWKNGNTTLTFLTKFEAPDEDSYSADDRNLIKLYADGTIDGDGNSSIENYLESSNSMRGKVENGTVKKTVTYGDSTDFEKADIIRMSGSGGNYIVSDKYLGYSIKYAGGNGEVSSGKTVSYIQTLRLYYIRNSYKITFNNVGSVRAGDLETVHPDYKNVTSENGVYSISYLYKDAIEWLPSVVAPPSNDPEIDDDYVFLGWYDSASDKAHQIMDGHGGMTDDGKQYLGDNGTMPAHNIQLFAHWAAPERTVTVNLDPKKTGSGASPLQGVKVTYNNNTYTADQNGKCTITIRKGDTLAGLKVDANTVKDHRVFKEWRILLGQQSVRLDDTLGIYDKSTEVDALWDRDDTVTYQMIAIDPTRPDGQNEIASWTSSLIPRGTEVTLDTAELQKMIPSGYVLQDGGDKAGEKKKIDSDGMVFRFYYKQPVGGWSYQIRQVIVYKDISHQNKTIEICHKILTRTTTDQQIVVNASDIFRQDSDAYDLDYMYAVSDEDGQTSKTQVTLTKPEKDGDIKTVTFKYTPDQELLDKMVSFTDQTLEYDGNIHEPVYTFKPNLYVKDAEDAADGSKEAALSKSVTYSYTDNQTGQTVSVEKGDIKTPETYTAAVEVKMTKGNKTITLLNKKRACLTIRPRVITISSNDYDYQYDGKNYQIPSGQAGDQGYKQTGDFVGSDGSGLKVTFENDGKPEQIGTIDNVISVSGLVHPEYYKVVLNYGKLTTTWPLTVRHVLLYGPDTTEDGKLIQQQVSLSTEQMDHNTDKTVTVSPLNLNDTETHWYGLEVSKKSSENNNNWQVSYNSESNEYLKSADGKPEVKYSRYDAEKHTYTVYYELPMLKGSIVVDSDGKMTFKDPTTEENAKAYETDNKKLYAGAKLLVDMLNEAVSKQEIQDQSIMTRTTYSYRLESSMEGKKLSLNLIKIVKTYKDTDKDGNLSDKEIKDQDQATDNASKPTVRVTPTELRSVTIDAQQTSSGGQEAPASSSP